MKKLYFLIVLSLCALTAMAQNGRIDLRHESKTEIVKNDFLSLRATFSYGSIESIEVPTERGTFSEIAIEGTYAAGEIGAPELPTTHQLLAVPFGATPRVSVTNYTTTDYHLSDYGINTLVPRQASVRKDQRPEDIEFAYNASAYQTRSLATAPEATIEVQGTLRGIQIGSLVINPMSYNPAANTLRVFNNIEVEVSFDDADIHETERMLLSTYSPYFDIIYKQMFNYRAIQSVYDDHPDLMAYPVHMIVVTPQNYVSALQPWINWKIQKGFDVNVVTTAQAGNNYSAIRSYIQNLYNTGVSQSATPTFLILVGDVAQVPNTTGSSTQKVTDLYYGSVDGDYFPDMFYSRMSAENTTQLTSIVNKILQYEQYTMPDPSYLNNVTLIAGWDSYWNAYIGRPTINYATTYYYNTAHGFNQVNAYLQQGQYTGCYNTLNTGVGFINYTAHGSETSWSDPQFTVSNVNALTNTNKYFLAMGNCCLTGNFGYNQPCFGEAMLRGANKAAYSYIGSCPVTYWYEDYYFGVGATNVYNQTPSLTNTATGVYDGIWMDDTYNTVSSMTFLGNIAVCYAHAGNYTTSASPTYYWQAYHVLGDGSIMPYRVNPTANTVNHATSISASATSFTVSAEAGSYVGISQNNVLKGAALIPAGGSVNVPVSGIGSGQVHIVVTKPQRQPYIQDINVSSDIQYIVNVSAFPSVGGNVTGEGTFNHGSSCTISASAYDGYSFFQWNDGVTTNPRTIMVTQDTSFVAFFRDSSEQNGGFSISNSQIIRFSSGNLQYQASTDSWRFAPNQYDIIGQDNSNISSTYDGWIDLFGWGTSGWNCGNTYYRPYDNESSNNAYYYYGPLGNHNLSGDFANSDWGVFNSIIDNGNDWGPWRTLSSTEFFYLLNYRVNATEKRSLGSVGEVHGLILLPDTWEQPSSISFTSNSNDWTTNNYTISQWQLMENNGAIFLPAAGNRGYTTISLINNRGSYWTTDCFNGYAALALRFDLTTMDAYDHNYYRSSGLSVRLVKDKIEYSIWGESFPLEGGIINGSGIYEKGSSCTLTASSNTNYSFVNWTENGCQLSTNPSYSFIVTGNRTIKANFIYSPSNFTISATANPSYGGSVTGGGTYTEGTSCTVTATANSGYDFVNWTENGTQVSTNANYTFTVNGNRNLVANFQAQPQQYAINVTANPNSGGSVTGGGTYTQGTSCTVTATANSGYDFVNWTENGTQVSTNANYTFTVNGNRNLVANFQAQPQQYAINVTANPNSGGSVTGGGTYTEGTSCTVSATANSGYDFVNWTENGTQVSTNANYTFTVNGNRNLVANFQAQPQQYTISVTANPSSSGSVTGGGTYTEGTSCTVSATANSGYDFVNWTENGAQVSINANYTFTVNGNRNLVANFQTQPQQYTISVTANPSSSGSVTGGGTYTEGTSCTVSATANSGYDFVNWTENGTQVSTNANYTFTVNGNRNLVANFQAQPQQYTISVTASPSNGGSVTGGGTYTEGTSCTVSATANSGYDFVNWTENGAQVSINANYTFTVNGNRNLVANFQTQPQQYTISVTANPSSGGSVTGGGTYTEGTSCTVNATANTGYTFVNWTENGTQVSTSVNYSFTVTGNRNLVAHFTTQGFVITAIADPTAGGVVTGSGGYNYGETCTLTATPNTGYTFQRWTKNGTQVSTSPTYSFTVTESATYTAHFNAQNYTVTVAANPSNAGSVSGGGVYTYGQTCTVTASANSNYTFTNWTENGTQVSTNASYSFSVTRNRNLVANFAQNTYIIQASAGDNGIITPSGSISVSHGANQTFTMIPNSGFEVQDVLIDGNSVGAMTSYTFTNVTSNHRIHVSFAQLDGLYESNGISPVVYPNPTDGEVIVECEGLSNIRIVNAFGQTVYNAAHEGEQVRIDLSQMAKGIYMMHIEAEGGQAVRKIVVE